MNVEYNEQYFELRFLENLNSSITTLTGTQTNSKYYKAHKWFMTITIKYSTNLMKCDSNSQLIHHKQQLLSRMFQRNIYHISNNNVLHYFLIASVWKYTKIRRLNFKTPTAETSLIFHATNYSFYLKGFLLCWNVFML